MRSTPLQRKTPLARHAPPKRKTPLWAHPILSKLPLVAELAGTSRRAFMKRKAPKAHTVAEQAWMDAVQALGCIVCADPALIHHVRSLGGVRIKRNHMLVLPLCWRHHSADSPEGFHAGTRTWQRLYGTEGDLLVQVDVKLGRARTAPLAAWVPCPCCENFLCTIHGGHAHDCDCPDLECFEFATGMDPYSEGGHLTPEELEGMVAGA